MTYYLYKNFITDDLINTYIEKSKKYIATESKVGVNIDIKKN